ncbi:MAG TPA: hypothetical protein VN132_15225 [Bdellovibrio sp.]|nr:hypothetical protein [Bdellovibrio sp.]
MNTSFKKLIFAVSICLVPLISNASSIDITNQVTGGSCLGGSLFTFSKTPRNPGDPSNGGSLKVYMQRTALLDQRRFDWSWNVDSVVFDQATTMYTMNLTGPKNQDGTILKGTIKFYQGGKGYYNSIPAPDYPPRYIGTELRDCTITGNW